MHPGDINDPKPMGRNWNGNTLNEYQQAAVASAIYPGKGSVAGLMYCALKYNGEAGEFGEHLGKALRDDGLPLGGQLSELTPERREKLILELGDGLWYIAAAAKELGLSLNDVAERNINKLLDRKARGVLQGSGDKR